MMMGMGVGVIHRKVGGRGHKPRSSSGHLETEKGKKMGFSLKASGGNQDC